MIFRRPDPAPTKPSNANMRRDPDLVGRPLPSQSTAAATPSLPPAINPQQARAKTPAAQFARTEQMRTLTVGRDISLSGEIGTCDHLIVEGTVKATIKGGKMLEIAETGTFSGMVEIDAADIAGNFEGELIVRGKLAVRPTARVNGIIHYGRLQVDTGAQINAQMQAITAASVASAQASVEHIAHSFADVAGFLKASA
jgi:cytoskeletal protein CcmA (bactofilin family)